MQAERLLTVELTIDQSMADYALCI